MVSGRMVTLVPHTPEHHHEFAHLLTDHRIWEQGFAPGHTQPPASYDAMLDFIQARAAKTEALYTILVDGQIAGTTGVVHYYRDRKVALVGRSVLGTAFWGQGINDAAKALLFDWLFSSGARYAQCEVSPGNHRSLRALERAGFVQTGTRRRHTPGMRAPWRTLLVLRLSRKSWLASRQPALACAA